MNGSRWNPVAAMKPRHLNSCWRQRASQHGFRQCHALEFILDRGDLQLGFAAGLEDVAKRDWNRAALWVFPFRQFVCQLH